MSSTTATTMYREMDMRFWLEQAAAEMTGHLGLGKLYGRTGKREQARKHLTTATTMYRDMDMRFWLEQVERELRGA